MSNKEIDIFCIAKTQVDKVEIRRWLDYLNVSDEYQLPPEEVCSNPALNIALAAKRCYLSFEPSLNPNVNKVRSDFVEYFDNIFKSGHGCYDIDTDVLTIEGWKNWSEITDRDEFATLHNGKFKYSRANKILEYDYSGRMYHVDAQGVNLLVTPNHNMYVCKTTTKEGRKRQQYGLIKAEDLGHVSHCYLKSLPDTTCTEPSVVEQSPYRLLGFAIGDGCYEDGNIVRFHLHKERKIEWLKSHAELVGWELKSNSDNTRFTLTVPPDYLQLFKHIYNTDRDKVIPQRLLFDVSQQHILYGLYYGLIESDGSIQETHTSFHSVSAELINQFQHLCILINKATTVGTPHMPGFGNRLIHTIFVLGKNNKPEVNKCNGHVGKTEWVDNFEGTVYCAELPDDTDHVLFVRRNGKSVWCGNSVTEHSCFSFAIEGISRVFTAEMNRHRAGWAISEGSLRYIRFDKDLTWWLPNSLRVNESDDDDLKQRKLESQRVFNEAFSHQEKCYGELLQIWDMNDKDKNFDYKKKVTSCLRRIVGMGVATGGVWTGNVRALRHVLTLRASAHAEEEILHVFSKVAAKMKEEEPLLFGDFVEDENGFWRPKYVKV